MRHITITAGSDIRTIPYIIIDSITNKPIIMGNKRRTIDGGVLTYNYGKTREYTVSLSAVKQELHDFLIYHSDESTVVTVDIVDSVSNVIVDSFQAVLDLPDSQPFKNFDNLYAYSITIMGTEKIA
jgi:hypothetical protein